MRRFRPALLRIALLALLLPTAQAISDELRGGRVVWWGRNAAIYPQSSGVVQTNGEFLSDVVAIAVSGYRQGLAVRSDGVLVPFGLGGVFAQQAATGLSNIASIAAEGDFVWAVRHDGSVIQWRRDSDFLGIASGWPNVKSVAWAGYRSYLALRSNGNLDGFRLDEPMAEGSGAVGIPSSYSSLRPVAVQGRRLSNILALGSMVNSPVVLSGDGVVYQLSEPVVDTYSKSPALPYQYKLLKEVSVNGRSLSNVTSVAGSGAHALALNRDGTVVAWGNNSCGECLVPAGLSHVIAIAAAEHLSLALKSNGTVAAWGGNYRGQTSVPAGLSNVIAIAAGGSFSLAITTGAVPAEVVIQPRGRLDEMARKADLVFKGRVLSSVAITNDSFPLWGKPHATELEVISVLQGSVPTNVLIFQHNTSGPMTWSGGRPPAHYVLAKERAYLIFATKTERPGVFRQLPSMLRSEADGVTLTLDTRPLPTASVKEAHWLELNRLLTHSNPTNALYAIQRLNLLSKGCGPYDYWPRSDDFERTEVLRIMRPLLTNQNETVAIAAIACFRVAFPCAKLRTPHVAALLEIASSGRTIPRRVAAIAALTDSRSDAVRSAAALWLNDSNEDVRAQAVSLLPDFSGEFAESALRKSATDVSAKVRAVTADAIGSGRMTNLLPTLAELFQDPVGRDQPLPPLTHENLESGGRAGVCCDVHTSAGFALLKFDVNQVTGILKANLNDAGFRLQFLCKLAEKDVKPYLDDMTEIMELRRVRNLKKAEVNGAPPETYMYLSGTYYQCWKIIYDHLQGLAFAEFANGKSDRYLAMLENAGTTGSQEPLMIYELYKMKGLNRRAARLRQEFETNYAVYSLKQFFDKVDAKYPMNGMIPDQ